MSQMMQSISVPAPYIAAGGTVFLGLNIEQWGITAAVVGIAFTILTYCTNLYFKRKSK